MSVPPRIGFIGLGIMGRAMALNLHRAGFQVAVYNRTRARTTEFADLGCEVASTPRALAKMCDTIITMVSDPAAIGEVMDGPEGAASAFQGGNALINMSTLSPDCTSELAKKCYAAGVVFLDCPVSGSKAAAEKAQLVILAGAEKPALERYTPVLKAMGKEIVHAGLPPAGTALKLCVNLIVAQLTTALAESAALAQAQGIDPALIFETLAHNPALNCGYFSLKKDNILKRDFPAAFPLRHMLKDARFMLAEAAKRRLELPVTAAVERLMTKSYNSGYGDKDLSVVLDTLAEPL
ncbi:MAG: NAD(P)-dependent oxidoreductase [Elusimicrobia bacterium HGW-Elusimicrobia-3]|nr:MAG: NAD(P)-dependent oxidoreductase [Elusimicrobia bacterium HGW-Elusimicrobia-3]